MNLITTVTSKGQITIPQEIRVLLGIKPGDKAIVQHASAKTGEVTLKVVDTKNAVDRLYGSLHKSNTPYIDIHTAREIAGKKLAEKYGLKPNP